MYIHNSTCICFAAILLNIKLSSTCSIERFSQMYNYNFQKIKSDIVLIYAQNINQRHSVEPITYNKRFGVEIKKKMVPVDLALLYKCRALWSLAEAILIDTNKI